ncbi:MAG TPA: recombinase family protein [Dehalococcoidia bacterium]|jgi:site-specific DNA recombinase|nr:recombinase family protein [Dehalococcoidia bacterium]
MKVAVYCRVSTTDQDVTVQERLCREFCQRSGHEIYQVYIDNGVSGMKASRPAFDDLLRDMRHCKFNCIVVTKLDRIGRSLQHILSLFEEFTNKGVHFISITQNIDTSSSFGKFQLHVLGAFAEFERNIISERTREGLKFAKNVGKRGKDKRKRKKRGVARSPLVLLEKTGMR